MKSEALINGRGNRPLEGNIGTNRLTVSYMEM